MFCVCNITVYSGGCYYSTDTVYISVLLYALDRGVCTNSQNVLRLATNKLTLARHLRMGKRRLNRKWSHNPKYEAGWVNTIPGNDCGRWEKGSVGSGLSFWKQTWRHPFTAATYCIVGQYGAQKKDDIFCYLFTTSSSLFKWRKYWCNSGSYREYCIMGGLQA